jgi:hypothetical protein
MMEGQEDVLNGMAGDDAYGIYHNETVCKKIIEFCDLTIAYLNE